MEKVIVVMLTYNLKDYISQALESVLAQKTSFSFKIVIADDVSTDGTVDILMEYQKRHPDIIEVRTNEKNMGCLANSNRVFDKLDCEYFCLLDGDDYWVGEDHLQKQVDLLDSHPEYSIVAGNTQLLIDDKLGEMIIDEGCFNREYSFQDLLDNHIPFVHTSGSLLRNTIYNKGLPQCYFDTVDTFENCALRGEDFRRITHLEKGKLFIMPEVVSVYRIHKKGIWQGSTQTHKMIESLIQCNFIAKYYGDKYGLYFLQQTKQAYQALMNHLVKNEKITDHCSLNKRDLFLLNAVLTDMCEKGVDFSILPIEKQKALSIIKKVVGKVLRKTRRILRNIRK